MDTKRRIDRSRSVASGGRTLGSLVCVNRHTRENWTELRDDLLAIATSYGDFFAKPSPFGVKYEAVGELGTEGHEQISLPV